MGGTLGGCNRAAVIFKSFLDLAPPQLLRLALSIFVSCSLSQFPHKNVKGWGLRLGHPVRVMGRGCKVLGNLRTAEMKARPRAGGRVLTPTSLLSHPGLSVWVIYSSK